MQGWEDVPKEAGGGGWSIRGTREASGARSVLRLEQEAKEDREFFPIGFTGFPVKYAYVVANLGCQPNTPGKKEPELKNCLPQFGLWLCCRLFSWLVIDVVVPSPL